MGAAVVSPAIFQGADVMNLSIGVLPQRLPRRFPIGATYVVEGYGGEQGDLRVISRYVVLPGGRRINVPGEVRPVPAPAVSFRRGSNTKLRRDPNRRQPPGKNGHGRARKKITARAGTR
jgi:hypothetical protein